MSNLVCYSIEYSAILLSQPKPDYRDSSMRDTIRHFDSLVTIIVPSNAKMIIIQFLFLAKILSLTI